MPTFRTEIQITPKTEKITYNNSILMLGSCFTENIGQRLATYKMQVYMNPFGIIFNPVSVLNGLQFLYEKKIFIASDLDFFNDLWFSYYHHGRFSDSNIETCLQNINSRIKISSELLINVDYIFITFGTARIYKHIASNRIVSNCHKIPASEFTSQLLEVNNIVEEYSAFFKLLLSVNPKVKIIFTVSPVRHWSDGAEENQISKATLLLAIHYLKNTFPNILYFPSYEILMDDLRDYRFYNSDMLHPNETAINYIWSKLSDTFFDKETLSIQKEIEKINNAVQHRPFNKDSENHQKFVQNTLTTIASLEKKFSGLNFEEEKLSLTQNIKP